MADVASNLKDWSTTASSNSPADATTIGGGLADNLQEIQAVVRQLAARDTIASAATTDLGTKNSAYLTISGTTTITSLGTVSEGIWKWITFSGALTLTHNGTSLILPGSANIITAAGDCALFLSLGSGNWRCLAYILASGKAVVETFSTAGSGIAVSSGTASLDVDGLTGVSAAEDDYVAIADTSDSNLPKKALVSSLAAMPRSYLAGLALSNAADADHDITVAAGTARDSTNAYTLTTTGLTKQIDATWAAGTNAGGLFSGVVANATWYHFFLIRKDSDGSIDAGFDTSVTAANIPAGYTAYRRIGSVLTNGSANIIGFSQFGDEFLWNTPVLDYNSTQTTTAALRTLTVPTGVKVFAKLTVGFESQTAATTWGVYISSPDQTDVAANTQNYSLSYFADASAAQNFLFRHPPVRTNISGQVRAIASTTVNLRLGTHGWVDHRGRMD